MFTGLLEPTVFFATSYYCTYIFPFLFTIMEKCHLAVVHFHFLPYYMACNGVLTPPAKVTPPQIGKPLDLTPPEYSKFLLPPLRIEMATSAFTHMATSNKHMFIFLKLL